MTTKKKIGKQSHDFGWRMPEATTKIYKLNYKGDLDWLKRCLEHFL